VARIPDGTALLEHLAYIVIDAVAVLFIVLNVVAGSWSAWWLLVAVPIAALGLMLILGLVNVLRGRV
jgi:hypothetical protein